MRFHRNTGAHGEAEWVAGTDDNKRLFGYARVMLVRDVEFVLNGADGWALGELRWCSEPMSRSRRELLDPEIARKVRPGALARLPIHGWQPLWFRRDPPGFTVGGRHVVRAKGLLLGPSFMQVWAPTFANA